MQSSDRRSLQRGFSLLEVLVAFSIMALALGVLYQATGGGVRATAHAERHAHAVIMAESLLARFDSVPAAGLDESGSTEDGYRWHAMSRPYDAVVAGRERDTPRWPFHILTLEVRWDAQGRSHSVRLDTVLPQQHDVAPQT